MCNRLWWGGFLRYGFAIRMSLQNKRIRTSQGLLILCKLPCSARGNFLRSFVVVLDYYRAGSPKNCVSHATPYSCYVSSQKRLIIFALFVLLFPAKDCIQRFLMRSLNFSVNNNPERNKSTHPRKTQYYQKYSVFIRKDRPNLLHLLQNCLCKNVADIRAFVHCEVFTGRKF